MENAGQKGSVADPIFVRNCLVTFPLGGKQDVPAERDGKIMKIFVKLGDRVKEGDVLAQVEDNIASADVQINEAKVKAADSEVRVTIMIQKEAEKKADNTLRLFKINAEAREKYDLDKLTAEKYREDISSKGDAKRVAEKELVKSEKILEMHKIRSLTNGEVKSILKPPGEVVRTSETVFEIHNPDRVRLEGLVDVYHLERLRSKPLDQFKVVVEYPVPIGPKRTLTGHLQAITSVAVSNNKQDPYIVSASDDGYVIVWDRAQQREFMRLYHKAPVWAVACTGLKAAENYCLSADADGKVKLWDLNKPTGRPLREVQEPMHRSGVSCVVFSPDGSCFATGGKDKEICLWNTATCELRYKFPSMHGGAITSLQFPLPNRLVSASEDFKLAVWDVGEQQAQIVRTLPLRTGDLAVPGVSSDGRHVLFDQGKFLRVLTLPEGKNTAVLRNPFNAANFNKFALFSPNNQLILTSGHADGWLQLWRAPTRQTHAFEVRQLVSTEDSTCAAFAPDGSFLVTGTQDHQVLVWPVPQTIDPPPEGKLTYIDSEVQSSDRQQIRIMAELDNPQRVLVPNTTVTMVIYDR
jgi:WD40 repeat protein